MKKDRRSNSKLHLSRETLRILQPDSMESVKGGITTNCCDPTGDCTLDDMTRASGCCP